jgi:hypothetical protein
MKIRGLLKIVGHFEKFSFFKMPGHNLKADGKAFG